MATARTARFDQWLTHSRTLISRVDICDALNSVIVPDVQITGGSVHVDRSGDYRRTATVDVAMTAEQLALVPTSVRRTGLDSFGNRMRIYAGNDYLDGTTELLPVALVEITESTFEDSGNDLSFTLAGSDLSYVFDQKKLLRPFPIPKGVSCVQAIQALLDDRAPGQNRVIAAPGVDYPLPYTLIEEFSAPWTDGVKVLAEAIGCEAYYDVYGNVQIVPVPMPSAGVVAWSYVEGNDCAMTKIGRKLGGPGRNGVLVVGEAIEDDDSEGTVAEGAPRGLVYDDNSDSPTYWRGPYGQRPEVLDRPLALTDAQAQKMAEAEWANYTGLAEQITLTAFPNPALDERDAIYVQRARGGFGDFIVPDAWELDLGEDADMPITGRTRRIAVPV